MLHIPLHQDQISLLTLQIWIRFFIFIFGSEFEVCIFTARYKLKFPLLSDADSEVSKLYGVLKMKSMYGRKYLGIVRSTFVIDENGILAAEFRDVKAKTSVADLEKALGIS